LLFEAKLFTIVRMEKAEIQQIAAVISDVYEGICEQDRAAVGGEELGT